jgi:carboxypeptidase PM20D1
VKRIAYAALAMVLALALIIAGRTAALTSRQVAPGEPAPVAIDPVAVAQRLAEAIRYPTVSWDDGTARDDAAFLALHEHLRTRFPRVHAALTREVVAGLSLLYSWPGSRADLSPVILLAHLDVVPAVVGLSTWTHPPFAGAISDGRVWGRGALDDKGAALGIFEAVEALLSIGYSPSRTVYLAFSHNEEGATDASGAATIAKALAARGVRDAWLLDEGGLIYDGVPGVDAPVAVVGIAEKTTVNLELRARAQGGHASMPPAETAVGLLARAIARLEAEPMPPRLDRDSPTLTMLQTLAPEMRWPLRTAMANLWLLRPIVVRRLSASPQTNATIRTTIAPTQLHGSSKANVLPAEAAVVLNVRRFPGDSLEDVKSHLRAVIRDDRVTTTVLYEGPTPPTSPVDTEAFVQLQRSIRAVYPQALVAPYLTIAGTDAREYAAIAPQVYRFLPLHQPGAVELIHGINEHIAIDAYVNVIRAYATIIRDMAR